MESKQDSKLTERQQEGLQLLKDTLINQTPNSTALGRVLLAIAQGELRVNGQAPDSDYCIGEYLIHGGRMRFDLTGLSEKQQNDFYIFITNNVAKSRRFATHRIAGFDADGSPAEVKSFFLGFISDVFHVFKPNHAGIDLAIGGTTKCKVNGVMMTPEENGEWGHMYLHKAPNMVMVGIEASGPGGKKNLRTGEKHSYFGEAGVWSPFKQHKINSQELINEQIALGKISLSTTKKYNWACVKISSNELEKIRTNNSDNYVTLVEEKHRNSQFLLSREERLNHMTRRDDFAKATEKGNQLSKFKIGAGVGLFVAGIVLCCVPIPGLAQAVGGWLVANGLAAISGATALSLVLGAPILSAGIGVMYKGTRREDSAKSKLLYEKAINGRPNQGDNSHRMSGSYSAMGFPNRVDPGRDIPPNSPYGSKSNNQLHNDLSKDETSDEDDMTHSRHSSSSINLP